MNDVNRVTATETHAAPAARASCDGPVPDPRLRGLRPGTRRRGHLAPRMTAAVLVAALSACGGGGDGGGPGPAPGSNSPPVIGGVPPDAIEANDLYDFTPLASDPDGDPLTFSAENLPAWLSLDAATGRLTGTATIDQVGRREGILIRASDGRASAALGPFGITVAPPTFSESDIVVEGTTRPVDTGDPDTRGVAAEGSVELRTADRAVRMEAASVQLVYDAQGSLIDLFGEANMPRQFTDTIGLNADVRARVGLFKGREINGEPAFGITLRDEFDYLVFYVGVATELEVGDRNNPGAFSTIRLELPASGEILVIFDPNDPFLYRFAGTPVGDVGYGISETGMIPFVPTQDFGQLGRFDGHTLEKASFPLGTKIFDFFTLTGTRVVRDPQFSDIDWDDPLDSTIEYRAGLNGEASFAFQILNVGLFEFDLAATSATFEVSRSRQRLAMQTSVAPDVGWQPDWFPILPSASVTGNWSIDGDGSFSATLTGAYRSELPAAAFGGRMELTRDGVTMSASIDDPALPLSLAMEFSNDSVTTQITTPRVDVAAIIDDAVDASFDGVEASIDEALADLAAATESYQGALSLNGFRASIPAIVDNAITILDGIPGAVRTSTYDGVLSGLRNTCRSLVLGSVCASDFVDEVARANAAANAARNTAQQLVNTRKTELADLRAQALEVQDGPAFRAALKSALELAADNARLSLRIEVSEFIDWPSPIPDQTITVFANNFNYTIIGDGTRDQLRVAAANVDDIDPAYTVYVDTQAIVDALPTKQVLQETRQGVKAGVIRVPAFNGAGYTVTRTPRELVLSSFVLLDDERYALGEVNVLEPGELLDAIGDAIADLLL